MLSEELPELLLRALRPVRESQDADDEREQRDSREEQLERDRPRRSGTRRQRTTWRRRRSRATMP
jgi:hypothetical protein